MASVSLHLINALSRTILRRVLERTPDPARARRDLRFVTRLTLYPPQGTKFAQDGPLTWITHGVPDRSRAILYFHGGGYIAGAPATHRAMLGRLSQLTGLPVAAPTYPLAPEHPAPAAFDCACAVHEHLLQQGFGPADLILGGDSAGGGLALALLSRLCATERRPAGCFVFSPWTDLTLSGASLRENAASDRLLPVSRIRELLGYVLSSLAPDDPRVSPLFASFTSPPPVLFQVALTEILRDDTLRMADKLRAAGGAVTVQALPDAPHVWQMLDGYLPEARTSLKDVAGFIRDLTPSNRPVAEN